MMYECGCGGFDFKLHFTVVGNDKCWEVCCNNCGKLYPKFVTEA